MKSGRYYARIYDPRTKRTQSERLRTSNRMRELLKAANPGSIFRQLQPTSDQLLRQ